MMITMRKWMLKWSVWAMVVCIAGAFAGCGSDDDDDKPVPEFKEAKMKYEFSFGEDFRTVADFTVTYQDADGTEKTETVTGDSWTKEFSATKLPFTTKIVLKTVSKNAVLDKASYRFTANYACSVSVYETESESAVMFRTFSSSEDETVAKDNVEAFLEALGERTFSYTVRQNEDGSYTIE